MKKTLICLLSIIFLLSTLPPFTASAATGTPISSADEFMAMKSGGEYYLTADITLGATYDQPFEGVLNGNGKSITISSPIFSDFSGKVENLTINGEIKATDRDSSAFALTSSKGFEAVKCTNNVSVTVTGNAKYVSGFVGLCYNAAVKFTDCVNNGNISLDSTADEKARVGGFGSVIDTLIMSGCVNNGNVFLKGNTCIAGGFVARVALNKGENYLEISRSENNGNVTVEDTYINKGGSDAGGLIGHIGTSGNIGVYKFRGCRNNGKIDAPYRVGGFVGYCYGSTHNAYVDMQFCINTGDVSYGRMKSENDYTVYHDYASAFVAYTNTDYTTIKYCIDTGKVILREGALTYDKDSKFIGLSSSNIEEYDIKGIYLVNKDQYKYFSWNSPELSVLNTLKIEEWEGVIATTPDDLALGRVAYEINLAAASDETGTSAFSEGYAFYQKLGEDALPSVDESRGWVVLSGDTYQNGDRPIETEPETETETVTTSVETTIVTTQDTTEPEETTQPVQSGCGGFSCYAVLSVIICASFILKKWSVVKKMR